jgi:hypothetical protein
MLANAPYILYSEDNEFQLPIYTINDNSISAYTTWSSEKIKEEYPIIKYYIVRTLDATTYTGTCSVTYAELNALLESDKIPYIEVFKNADINYKERYIVSNISRVAGNSYTELKLHAISNDGHIEITHTNEDVITATDNKDYNAVVVGSTALGTDNMLTFRDKTKIRFYHNVTRSISLNAQSYTSVNIDLDTTEFPPTQSFNDLLVFVNMVEGEPLEVMSAKIYLQQVGDDKWQIIIHMCNNTSATHSVTAKFDIMLVDLSA